MVKKFLGFLAYQWLHFNACMYQRRLMNEFMDRIEWWRMVRFHEIVD